MAMTRWLIATTWVDRGLSGGGGCCLYMRGVDGND